MRKRAIAFMVYTAAYSTKRMPSLVYLKTYWASLSLLAGIFEYYTRLNCVK